MGPERARTRWSRLRTRCRYVSPAAPPGRRRWTDDRKPQSITHSSSVHVFFQFNPMAKHSVLPGRERLGGRQSRKAALSAGLHSSAASYHPVAAGEPQPAQSRGDQREQPYVIGGRSPSPPFPSHRQPPRGGKRGRRGLPIQQSSRVVCPRGFARRARVRWQCAPHARSGGPLNAQGSKTCCPLRGS